MKASRDDFESFVFENEYKNILALDTCFWKLKNNCSVRGTILGFQWYGQLLIEERLLFMNKSEILK